MLRSLNLIRKVFCRNKALYIPYLMFLAAMIGYGLFRLMHYATYREYWGNSFDISPFEALLTGALGMYAFFLYIGYELGVRIREADMAETLSPLPGANVAYMGAAALWLAILALVGLGIAWGTCLSMYSTEPVHSQLILKHLAGGCLLYYFLTPLVGGMIGLMLSRLLGSRRMAVYPIVIFLVIASTSFLDRLLLGFYYSHESTATAMIPYWIKDWFTMTPYGMGISYGDDMLYLIPQELARWLLMLFWIGVSLLVTFAPLINGRIRRWSFTAACAIVAIGAAMGFCGRGMLVNRDERMAGISWMEESLYNLRNPMEAEDGGFTVESYDIRLNIGQRMKAEAAMELSPLETGKDTYTFTLHRYMKIDSLTNEDGQKIPYTRTDNVLRFDKSCLPDGGRVRICYSGALAAYHTNDQELLLPSWFSWYPMVGVRPVDVGGGHNLELPEEETVFRVSVQAPYPVVSNLSGGDNCFEGKSRSVTLMGSQLIREYPCRGMTFYVSQTENTGELAQSMLKLDGFLSLANRNLNCEYDAPLLVHPAAKAGKVFILPYPAQAGLVNSSYIDQGDHLWMTRSVMNDSEFLVADYLRSLMNPLNNDGWLSHTFINTILEKDDQRPDVTISDDPAYWLKKLKDFSSADPEEIPITHEIETVLYNCLDYLKAHGDGNYAQAIYARLQTPAEECETDQFIFIHDMMKEVMNNAEGQ